MAGEPGPLRTGGRTVPAEWIDYNGHMMDAYYFLAFTEATEALLDHVGLGAAYRDQTGCGMYTAETHLRFERGVRRGAALRYSSQVLAADAKRLQVFHRMAEGSGQVATAEMMFLHVDLTTERVCPMPQGRRLAVAELAARHAALPPPRGAGQRIAMRR
jgi:acyl-CoA thioester hydrolase